MQTYTLVVLVCGAGWNVGLGMVKPVIDGCWLRPEVVVAGKCSGDVSAERRGFIDAYLDPGDLLLVSPTCLA